MDTYVFMSTKKPRFIDANSEKEACDKFQERYGFWPDSVMKLEKKASLNG